MFIFHYSSSHLVNVTLIFSSEHLSPTQNKKTLLFRIISMVLPGWNEKNPNNFETYPWRNLVCIFCICILDVVLLKTKGVSCTQIKNITCVVFKQIINIKEKLKIF